MPIVRNQENHRFLPGSTQLYPVHPLQRVQDHSRTMYVASCLWLMVRSLCAHSQREGDSNRARSSPNTQSEEEPSCLGRSSSQMPRGETHRALLSSLPCQTSLPSHAPFIGAFLRVHSGSLRFFRSVCSSSHVSCHDAYGLIECVTDEGF